MKYTMDYVKFENTFNVLYELVDAECFEKADLSNEEQIYRKKLIRLCAKVCVVYGDSTSNGDPYQN